MTRLAIAKTLLNRLPKLDTGAQKRVQDLATKCEQMSIKQLADAKGLNLETYNNQRDGRARTIRLGDNHRGIVMLDEGAEHILLVDVLTHDAADRWMANNEFRVNAATGAFEIVDVSAITAEASQVTAPGDATAATRLFDHRPDKAFTQLGLDADLIPTLRAFSNEDQLQGLLSVLPQGQADALIMLTSQDSVESIYAEITGTTTPVDVDTDDLAAAITAPASMGSFHVVADEAELADMLAKPLAQWRTYLHRSQHDAAYKDRYNGPVRITGGAGTGKTVVAMHRAKALADRLENRDGKPILFTTFTRNLAQSIERDLESLGGTDLVDVVDVLNVDRLASRVVADAEGRQPGVASTDTVRSFVQDAIDEIGAEVEVDFVIQEWEQVVLAQDIQSRDQYFTASRAGRGTRLDRRARARVWKVIESVTQRLASRGQRTFLQIAAAAAGYLAQDPVPMYHHVIIDEAQDLHETQWRLLRAAVEEGPNDMFLVGDSHQRIYDRRSSLSKVGIHVVGRSKRLRINYRTTHEILRWALAMLDGEDFDDLDDGVDNHDPGGYHSFLHGSDPTVTQFGSRSEMVDELVDQITSWIDDGIDPSEIGVTGRTRASFSAIERGLQAAGIQCFRLGKDLRFGDGVALGTMHRLKGLEYRCVAVIDADDETLPLAGSITPASTDRVQHDHDVRRERCLLYVACTRARDDLWVGWAGLPSPFIP